MLRNHFKIALRNLVRDKVFSFINIAGLGLGMATAVLLILWVQNEWNYDSYHQKAKNIYRINTHLKINETDTWHWASTPLKLAEHLKSSIPEVKTATRLHLPYGDFSLNINNEILNENSIGFIDNHWFEVFDYQFIKGSAEEFVKDKYNIAISETKAKQFFGNTEPIGKIIKHDSLNFVVSAILKDVPSNSIFRLGVLAQNEARMLDPKVLENDSQWNNFNYQTFVVCSEGINTQKVSQKFTQLLKKLQNEKEDNTRLELQSLTNIHTDNEIEAEGMPLAADKTILYIFGIVAIFILLIACINYINLTTAKASQRTKEVGIKKIIGASVGNLFNQFFVESVITSFLAALLAIFLVGWGLPVLENLVENHFSLTTNPIIWLILGIVTMLSIVLTGIYPSVLLSSFQPIKLLKGINIGGAKNASFRQSLVVFQFTFTIVLLISTFFIYRQLRFIQDKKLGYDKENIFTFSILWTIPNKDLLRQTIIEKLNAESSVQDVTSSNEIIIDSRSTHSGSLNWKGKDPSWQPTVSQLAVSANFQDFFKLKLTKGRWFEDANKGDENNVVLNETAVRELKIPQPALGQTFEFHGRKGQIIGVAKDFHFRSPKEPIKPLVMFFGNNWLSTVFVKTTPNQFKNAIAATEKTWKELAPNAAFKYSFLDETYEKLHRGEQHQLQMFGIFAAIVLLISCFGLFGLATFSAEVRTKEIGIRKVLGASIVSIMNLLSKDFLKLVIISFVLASPVAWWLADKWLQDFAYRIEISWWVFVLAGLSAVSIALLTVSYQAIKAALMNPVESLKTE